MILILDINNVEIMDKNKDVVEIEMVEMVNGKVVNKEKSGSKAINETETDKDTYELDLIYNPIHSFIEDDTLSLVNSEDGTKGLSPTSISNIIGSFGDRELL